jgi:tetrahydromethanopterin S-methyltransferase subunit H
MLGDCELAHPRIITHHRPQTAYYLRAIFYGYPAGCSPTHIVRDRWLHGKDRFGQLGVTAAKVSLATSIMMMGADYFMYGIKQPEIVPAMAMVDAAISYTARQQKVRAKIRRNPLTALLEQPTREGEGAVAS